MSALEQVIAALGTEDSTWLGLAVAGWLVALLAAVLAIRQAARADGLGVRAAEAAHELRGPLCAARLALSSLQRGYPDAPLIVSGVAAVDLELDRAGLALEELASVGGGRDGRHAGASRSTREVVDLVAVVRAAEPAWRALAEARATTVELRTAERPVMVLGDPRRLLQGIENLVVNACEHGRGPVRVTVAERSEGVRIEVSDTGAGPSRKAIRRARRRARGRIPSRAGGSSRGHGMAIVARLARDSGGRLRALSGRAGTVIFLELPSPGPARSRVTAAIDQPRRAGRRVRSLVGHDRAGARLAQPLAGARLTQPPAGAR